MQRQARLPEIFDQIAQNIPVLEFGSGHPLHSPPPPKIEIRTDLGTLDFDFPEPPPPIEIWTDLDTLGFDFPEPPPPNWKLGRSWHFGFWWLEYVKTNRCIPQGYHLVSFMQCSCFYFNFWRTLVLIMGPLIRLFCTFGEKRCTCDTVCYWLTSRKV